MGTLNVGSQNFLRLTDGYFREEAPNEVDSLNSVK